MRGSSFVDVRICGIFATKKMHVNMCLCLALKYRVVLTIDTPSQSLKAKLLIEVFRA